MVYKGVSHFSKKTMAIKKINKKEDTQEDDKIKEEFFQEVKILSMMDHPNVVKMVDAIIDNSAYYIVME